MAAGVVFSHQISLFDNGMAVSVLSTAAGKCTLSFGDAFIRGIFCNFLVCLAVWISFAAKDVAGKIIGLFFPIMIFVVCGFEHSVANMYFIPMGMALGAKITISQLIKNLVFVTIGNIIGGAIAIPVLYHNSYLKDDLKVSKQES